MITSTDQRVEALEAALRSQGLELLRTRLDLHFYKAQIASRRWGSPGGNDKAIDALDAALADLDRASLPAELDELRPSLRDAVVDYREGLRALKVTATATNQTRLYRIYDQFVARLMVVAAGG